MCKERYYRLVHVKKQSVGKSTEGREAEEKEKGSDDPAC